MLRVARSSFHRKLFAAWLTVPLDVHRPRRLAIRIVLTVEFGRGGGIKVSALQSTVEVAVM